MRCNAGQSEIDPHCFSTVSPLCTLELRFAVCTLKNDLQAVCTLKNDMQALCTLKNDMQAVCTLKNDLRHCAHHTKRSAPKVSH